MIKQVIDEVIIQMSEKLFSCGLSRYQLNDASILAESIVLITFRDRIIKGKGNKLLSILNGLSTSGKTAFIDNFIQKLSKKIIEKQLINSYKIALIERLQMNSISASSIASEVMPDILKSIIVVFIKVRVDERTLFKIVNDGMPMHRSIQEEMGE